MDAPSFEVLMARLDGPWQPDLVEVGVLFIAGGLELNDP